MKSKRANTKDVPTTTDPAILVGDLRELIQSARQTVARGVNAALVTLYWQMGQRIRTVILREQRAGYGEKILPTLSSKLGCHRRLRRLVVIDLKLGRFAPADIGQMEIYLRWLKKHEMQPWEEEPLGLILCSEKSNERVEVFELAARAFTPGDQTPPCVVLWLDPERVWSTTLPALRLVVQELYTLGSYAPEDRIGPPLWLRCIEGRTIEGAPAPNVTPIFYLPGLN